MPASWRSSSSSIYEIGRAMSDIEMQLRLIRATGRYPNEKDAIAAVYYARRSARQMVNSLNALYRTVVKED